MKKVVLWGLGDGYNDFVSRNGLSMVCVQAIVDKRKIYNMVDDIVVLSPDRLVEESIEFDYIIVTVIEDKIYKEIVNEAVNMGVDRSVIIPSRVFSIPFFCFEDYISKRSIT